MDYKPDKKWEGKDRFVLTYDLRFGYPEVKIIVDFETGVNYLVTNVKGVTPLLNADGTPVVTKIND